MVGRIYGKVSYILCLEQKRGVMHSENGDDDGDDELMYVIQMTVTDSSSTGWRISLGSLFQGRGVA